ncbi:MAG: hypothetical protein K6G76_01715 [Lachnospiraceae bacterium]|nr:hypothetical protein [Lachnospiraceae bacterium]
MKNKTLFNIIICITALALVSFCVVLPRFILRRNTEKKFNTVAEVPAEYYSGPSEAVVKNASKQLSTYQKLQLISGIWDSEISEASDSEINITELDAKDLAITKLIDLSSNGLYPTNVDSDYQKWYSWEAHSYKAVDTTFQTYAAIYWDITFTKYDNSESHRIIITENGDVLFANASSNTSKKNFGNFSPKLDNIKYVLANDNYSDTSSKDINVTRITSSSDNMSLPTSTLLSSAENYINSMPHFVSSNTEHIKINADSSLTGAFIYGSENNDYTFVITFYDKPD